MMKKLLSITILLALSKTTYAVPLYPTSELLNPVDIYIQGHEIMLHANQDFLEKEEVDSIKINGVIGLSSNGNTCDVAIQKGYYSNDEDLTILSRGKSREFIDVSDDGCYPEMMGAIVETEKYGTWKYSKPNKLHSIFTAGAVEEISGWFNPNPDAVAVSVEVNPDKSITITSNLDEIEIFKVSGAHKSQLERCRAYIPNSNRTTKKLKLGESFTYHTEYCQLNSISVELSYPDNYVYSFIPYNGKNVSNNGSN